MTRDLLDRPSRDATLRPETEVEPLGFWPQLQAKIRENQRKSEEIRENQRKSEKIRENMREKSEGPETARETPVSQRKSEKKSEKNQRRGKGLISHVGSRCAVQVESYMGTW